MVELVSFFSLGFFGGFGHCIFMCNPFVIYIASKFAPNTPGYVNFLIPQLKYNIGRILTYSLLGLIFGSITTVSSLFSNMVIFQKIISILAGVFLIFYGISDLSGFRVVSKIEDNIFTKKIRSVISRFQFNSPFITGIVLGFLPCGLLYGALIGVSSMNNPIRSSISMGLFGVGTSFALIIVAIFGNIILKYRLFFRIVSFFIMLGMGAFFIYSGLKF